MKTLAEQIKNLVNAREEAYNKYVHAVEKEVNALLKRCGDEQGCTLYTMNTLWENDCKDNRNLNDCSPAGLAWELVSKYPYICKLRDKWWELNCELLTIQRSLKD